MPAWLWKTNKPIVYPANPNQVDWDYTQGTEIKDPTYKEAVDFYTRFAYWEVLNEVDSEHHWTPQGYIRFFDVLTSAMRKIDPDLKFVACASAFPANSGEIYRYFLWIARCFVPVRS